jgi:hypothetical protein
LSLLTAFLAFIPVRSVTPPTGPTHLDVESLFVLFDHRTNFVGDRLG